MHDIFAKLPYKPLRATCVAQFAPMTFLENLEIQPDGALLVTSQLDGRIWSVGADGRVSQVAQVDGRLASLASSSDGGWLGFGSAPNGTTRVFAIAHDGTVSTLLDIPECQFPNGVQRLGEDLYLLADSALGIIWQIDRSARTASIWLEHDLLKPTPGSPFPGINGIKPIGGSLYVTNSSAGSVIAIELGSHRPQGSVRIVAEGIPADDFAFDVEGNMYLTTHPFNTIIRLAPDGTRMRVAGPAQGVTGCTACRFDLRAGHRNELLVISDGGLFHPGEEGIMPAKIVRLETEREGAPVNVR
jgi:hypothetical protein